MLISFDQLLHDVGIQEEERLLSRLVVHALRCLNQSLQEGSAILRESGFTLAAHRLHDLLDLVDVDHLLRRASKRPKFEKALDQIDREQLHLLEVVLDTALQLGVERRQLLDLVERDQHFSEKVLVLLSQRRLQPRGDRTENLKELSESVVGLSFLGDPQEQEHNLLLHQLAQRHQLAVDAMQDRLQVVSFAGILTIE